jgi:hypothetical protein
MINQAITNIATALNQFLRRQFDLAEDIAIPSNIVEQDGAVVPQTHNKILVYLVNVEQETSLAKHPGNVVTYEDRTERRYPPIHLNIYLMFSANFSGTTYVEALKFLSCVISFFQRKPVFNQNNTPDLDPRILKLTLEIENLNIKDLSSLWTILSGKYMPSILYKVRMITYDADDVADLIPTVTTPQPTVKP